MIRNLLKAYHRNASLIFQRHKQSRCSCEVSQHVLDIMDEGYTELQKSNSKSLLKKYLTSSLYKKLRTKRTASSTLLDCIQSGLKNHDSGCGVYAADENCYQVFEDLFNPIIHDYHFGFASTDTHPKKQFGNPCSFADLDPNRHYIASTRIRCARSIHGFPFNPTMTRQNYDDIEDLIQCTLAGLDEEFHGTYYPLFGMDKTVQERLIQNHFLFKPGDKFLRAAKACEHWPIGRGIYYNYDKTFLVWCNEEDHLRIISMQRGGNMGEVYSRLVRALNAIEKKIEFSHHPRLGFLTFCPTNLGTTIRCSVHIRVPRLANDENKLKAIAHKYKLQVRGSHGEHSVSEKGIYDISNKRRLGITEYQAVEEMYKGIAEIIKLEQKAASGIKIDCAAVMDRAAKTKSGKSAPAKPMLKDCDTGQPLPDPEKKKPSESGKKEAKKPEDKKPGAKKPAAKLTCKPPKPCKASSKGKAAAKPVKRPNPRPPSKPICKPIKTQGSKAESKATTKAFIKPSAKRSGKIVCPPKQPPKQPSKQPSKQPPKAASPPPAKEDAKVVCKLSAKPGPKASTLPSCKPAGKAPDKKAPKKKIDPKAAAAKCQKVAKDKPKDKKDDKCGKPKKDDKCGKSKKDDKCKPKPDKKK